MTEVDNRQEQRYLLKRQRSWMKERRKEGREKKKAMLAGRKRSLYPLVRLQPMIANRRC